MLKLQGSTPSQLFYLLSNYLMCCLGVTPSVEMVPNPIKSANAHPNDSPRKYQYLGMGTLVIIIKALI